MSVKKHLILAAAGVLSAASISIAFAGGPDVLPMSTVSHSGAYVEGNLDYAHRNWKDFDDSAFGDSTATNTSNIRGGFTFNVDAGYQFNKSWSLEGGWYYFPKAKATLGETAQNVKSWFTYGATKMTLPVYDNTYVFGKFGAAYTHNKANTTLATTDGTPANSTRSKYWRPMFAVGTQYYLNQNVSVNAQYMYLTGYNKVSTRNFAAPVAHIFTVGVGYKFLI